VTAPEFDLQSHSHYSDGALPPEEVVARAGAAGVELLALSDHDSVDGVAEAIAAGREHGVVIVPAVEITVLDGDRQDLHLLGYGIDHEDPALLALLAASRSDREARAGRMAHALRRRGWALDEQALEERRASGRSIGRPHLAAAVFAHPDNAGRLRDEGLGNSTELLVAELVEGAPSHRGRTRPGISEAIAAIHAAGGVAVWAHPFWDIEDPEQVLDAIDRFAAQGLDGVEAFYITHTREQTLLLADACAQRGMLSTGSADFHGPDHPHFSAFRAFELHGREPNLGAIVADPPAGKHPAMRIWQREPLNAECAPDLLAAGNLTALNVFFVRSHGPTPAIESVAHRLTVAGLVDEPLELSLDELSAIGPGRFVVATLQCAGNRRRELLDVRPIEGEIPWGPGVIGTAEWAGVSLADVLARAGVRDGATDVELIGEDLDPEGRSFGGSIPLAKAHGLEVLLATHMNGQPLTAVHGAPVRAVVPGYVGARSVKWLREIRVLGEPSRNHYQAVAYRVHPPSVTDRNADPACAIPLGGLSVNAAILTPGDGARLPAGEVVLMGYAISGGANRIERVDVTTDGGATWRTAELLDPPSAWAWRRWRLTLELSPGDVEVSARAIDSSVNTQPENPAHLWNVQGYANNARPRVRLRLV
jgi:DMSO/TMAO reductase YedYZ molybdopterin-dependent catalytic subunit/predicted metal-dependent phosphoesterase TrpH